MIGPPTEAPKVFRIRAGRATPLWLFHHVLDSVNFSRLYSNNDPWKLLVPLLVTSEICAPEEWPEALFPLTVETRNSWIASEFSRSTGPLRAGLVLEIELFWASFT